MAKGTGSNSNLKNQLAKQAEKPAVTPAESFQAVVKGQLAKQFKAMQSLVPKHVTPERLARVGLQAISRNPGLMECSPDTIVGSIMNCATLGLEPNLIGHAYIVPFWNGKAGRKEAQFQIGYKGLIDLIRRTGEVSRIYAHEVYENDEFIYEYGLEKNLKHKPAPFGTDRGKTVGYYAVYHLKDGGSDFEVMSKEDVIKHMNEFSKSKDKSGKVFGPWKDHFDEMAKKTVLRKLIKYMPISIEQQENKTIMEGISADEKVVTVKEDIGNEEGSFLNAEYVYDDEPEKEPEKEPEVKKQETPKKNTSKKEETPIEQMTADYEGTPYEDK